MSSIQPPSPQPHRDRYGRPLVTPPDGGKAVPYRRCTTFVDVLDDRWALEAWKQRQVAAGLAVRSDLVLKAAAAAGDKTELNQVTKEALEAAGSSAAATTGSAVHSLTEQLDRGQQPVIPPQAQPDVAAYQQATTGIVMRMAEVFVVHDELQVGGTFDRVAELADGTHIVVDIKTSATLNYAARKFAMQLALYSRSQHYNIHTGHRSPLNVNQHRGLVIHIPSGGGEANLAWVDLDAGWEGVTLAASVWRWRGRDELLNADPPSGPPNGHHHDESPDLMGLIELCGDVESLRDLWRSHTHVWTDRHTKAAQARMAQLNTATEPQQP